MSVKTLIEEYLRQPRPLGAGPGCASVSFTARAEQLRQQERLRRAQVFLRTPVGLTASPAWVRYQEQQQQRRAQIERLHRAQAFLSVRVGPLYSHAAPNYLRPIPDLAALGRAALERLPVKDSSEY